MLSCDCFVFIREATTRNTAGFPTKFSEAFTCGVPFITTDVSDVAAYIDSPEKGIILPDASVDMIREAMESAAARSKVHNSKFIEGPVADLAPDFPSRTLRNTFDYRNFIDETKEWINRTLN